MATQPPPVPAEPCPVCGAQNGSEGCPLFPVWASEAKTLYFFEAAKRGQALAPEVRAFWAAALEHYLRSGKRALSFAPEELTRVFTRRAVLRPLCLARVAAEADARGETAQLAGLSPEAHAAFVAAGRGVERGGGAGPRFAVVRWALRTLVLAPLAGAWSLVAGHDELAEEYEEEEEEGESDDAAGGPEMREPRAHLGLLQEVSAALAQHFTHRLDAERTVLVLSPSSSSSSSAAGDGVMGSSGPCTLWEACQVAAADVDGVDGVRGILEGIADQDCLLLADFLMTRGLAARDGPYLKILGDDGGKKMKMKKQGALTEADKKLLNFRMQVRQLEAALARREADMLAAKQRAIVHHRAGRTHQAAVELARSKKLGVHAGKLQEAVLNLLSLHYSIEGVAADVTVFEGLKGGNAALRAQRAVAARAGLGGVKDVDEAMAEARELVAGAQEVAAALAQEVHDGDEEKEVELLRELEALEKAQEEEQRQEQQVPSDLAAALPDVSHLPPPPVVAATGREGDRGGRRTAVGVALSS